MKIELLSFIFGVVITLAAVIIIEHIYGKIFGNRRLKQLQRETKRLKAIVQKKDELIRKSLQSIEDQEKNYEDKNR